MSDPEDRDEDRDSESADASTGDGSVDLASALSKHGVSISEAQIHQLQDYCQLLWQWNEKLNLTRHLDYDSFVSRDVVDSMELSKHLKADERVLDVGTGGGVPGIILAILRPDVKVSLCESVSKKAEAVAHIVSSLGLNVPVFNARAEDLFEDLGFDTIVARAVGPLWKILKWFQASWSAIGRMLLIKGPAWVEERKEARHRGLLKPLQLRKLDSYNMPGRDSESVILVIWPKDPAK